MTLKQKTWRSAKYLAYVKTLPCVACVAPADDAHHLSGIGNLSGMGMKPPDWATLPLCRGHHTSFHALGRLKFEAAHGGQLEHIALTLGGAIQDGVLKI